jgi:hypothetical protein
MEESKILTNLEKKLEKVANEMMNEKPKRYLPLDYRLDQEYSSRPTPSL